MSRRRSPIPRRSIRLRSVTRSRSSFRRRKQWERPYFPTKSHLCMMDTFLLWEFLTQIQSLARFSVFCPSTLPHTRTTRARWMSRRLLMLRRGPNPAALRPKSPPSVIQWESTTRLFTTLRTSLICHGPSTLTTLMKYATKQPRNCSAMCLLCRPTRFR